MDHGGGGGGGVAAGWRPRGERGRQKKATANGGLNEYFGESGSFENEPTAPAEQAHTTRRQWEKNHIEKRVARVPGINGRFFYRLKGSF